MEASDQFFLAVGLAYLVPCLIMLCLVRYRQGFMGEIEVLKGLSAPKHKWIDLIAVLVVVAAIFGLGRLYAKGWLLPDRLQNKQAFNFVFMLNNLIIYSPLFIAIAIRRQSMDTMYISFSKTGNKLCAGIVMAVVGCSLFYMFSNRTVTVGGYTRKAFSGHALQYFLPVFLEGAAVAFAYVRLRWITNSGLALLIPSLLFGAAHLHYSIDAHKSLGYIIGFFLFNVLVVSGVLFMLQRIRDVIWIGVLHYFMDVAINAFNQ